MEKEKAMSLTSEFGSIRQHAASISNGMVWIDQGLLKNASAKVSQRSQYLEVLRDYLAQAKTLVAHFNSALEQIPKEVIHITQISTSTPVRGYLREIMIGCDKILGYLRAVTGNLNAEDNQKLTRAAQEAREISDGLDVNYGKSIDYAREAIENGQFFGGAMILSRVVDHALDQIEGTSVEEKIERLTEAGAVKKDAVDIKKALRDANEKAKNYLSNRVDTFPTSSDALALFSNCAVVLNVLRDYRKNTRKK